ncbi:uncharacterized protein LOC114352371 [Ostrinia furnacalis]|uniref:uncharacterized protein LOC114352371 n=1 Tax=Ostrinia furnacalis TaxID=93504 RepID=UPI00103CFFEE|nr:uncharacterized protein LOC114352371 [Ostrinia furnacalis]
MKMLACVCQPTETALLFKGGPPVAMGPLGSSKIRNQASAMKGLQLNPKEARRLSEDSSHPSSPTEIHSTGSLLNLRKIEKKAKSTKILVNPVCSDSVGTSDDSNPTKTKKWNGKKKRLKSDEKLKPDSKYSTVDSIKRVAAKEDKTSISCFKIKCSDDKSRSDDDKKSGRENCSNENASNLISAERPDLINHSRKNSREILVDEGTMTDESTLRGDQQVKGKTDIVAVKDYKVSGVDVDTNNTTFLFIIITL